MSTERKEGVIWSFNPTKGVGTLIDDETRRWFFHAGRVIAGPAHLDVGMTARFIIQTDEKPKPGRLPSAFEIEISNYARIEALVESSKEAK